MSSPGGTLPPESIGAFTNPSTGRGWLTSDPGTVESRRAAGTEGWGTSHYHRYGFTLCGYNQRRGAGLRAELPATPCGNCVNWIRYEEAGNEQSLGL